MKFKSPSEKEIFLALTNGHTCTIGPELVEVPERFHRLAVAEGAIPEGMEHLAVPKDTQESSRKELVSAAIKKMLEGSAEGDFNGDGKPDTRRLSAAAGFTVSRAERDEVWAAVKAELNLGEDD
jgi:hypothetical protein